MPKEVNKSEDLERLNDDVEKETYNDEVALDDSELEIEEEEDFDIE